MLYYYSKDNIAIQIGVYDKSYVPWDINQYEVI